MQATLTYQNQGLLFEGQADSGHTIRFDSPLEVGGTDQAIRPMEGFLLSMLACFSADVVSILQKKRKTLTHYQIQAQAQRAADHPMVFTEIHLRLILTSPNAQPVDVERAIELSQIKYCSAMAMVARSGCTITIDYELQPA